MNKIIDNFSVYYSTLFGIGYFPKAPGTAGSVFAFFIYQILPENLFLNDLKQFFLLGIILCLSLISVFFVSKAEKKLGHDASHIVIDEFLGYFIALLFLPKSVGIGLMSLILFRFFDIVKPEPVNILQKLPKGWGVLADDLMAGLYSNIILQVLIKVIKVKFLL